MSMTPDEFATLLQAFALLNFLTVMAGVLAVDVMLWALSRVRSHLTKLETVPVDDLRDAR